MIPTAMLVLLVPAFFASVLIGAAYLSVLLKDQLAGGNFKKRILVDSSRFV